MKFDKRKVAALVAELVGTFALTIAVLSINRYGIPFFTAIIAGVTLATLVAMFGYVSGGHFNPAVTFGMLVARKVTLVRALVYISMQMLGATGAWKLYEYMTGRVLESTNTPYDWKVFTAEAVGTLLFAAAIAAAVSRGFDTLQKTVVIGAGLFIGASIASLASSGVLNPAVAFGLQSFTYEYVFGPLAGAVVGVVGYNYFFSEAVAKKKK